MTENPTKIASSNDTIFNPMFTSDSVLVMREQWAFSFGALVADCGGVLGLFIGFNFLMVCDWIVSVVSSLVRRVGLYNKT